MSSFVQHGIEMDISTFTTKVVALATFFEPGDFPFFLLDRESRLFYILSVHRPVLVGKVLA